MNKRKMTYYSTLKHRLNGVITTLLLIAAGFASTLSHGGQTSSALVLPDDMNYYNPLKHGREDDSQWIRSTGMSSEELLRSAGHIRSQDMSQQQRALNHQWLLQQDHQDVRIGGKVVSKLVKMGFRTYWDGVRNKHYRDNKAVPTSNGNGQITQDVDYKIRLSGDKLKLSVSYEF